MEGAVVFVRRYVLSLNALALVLLALQNAGYLVLMGYVQQLQMVVPDDADGEAALPSSKKFISSHFLVTVELVKLFLSTAWCAVDEMLAMQKDGDMTQLLGDAERPLPGHGGEGGKDTSDSAVSTPSQAVESAAERVDQDEKRQSRQWSAAADAQASNGRVPLHVLLRRRRFMVLLLRRMRHAIGLDRKYKETLLMVVPASVYAIQGLLLIYALKLLDPAMFQVLYQVRIIFTALMMRAVLDFHLSAVRWVALVALMMGITMTQLGKRSESLSAVADEGLEALKRWSLEGTLAALAGAFLSAFSGVFMEFVLKKRGNHFYLSARNVHLAFFSLFYFAAVFLGDLYAPDEASDATQRVREFCATFFDGFTPLLWFVVVLQAFGGLLVALVVRYCDNIVKSFSTSCAIVLSGTASVFLFDLPLSACFVLGALLVMASVTVYSLKK